MSKLRLLLNIHPESLSTQSLFGVTRRRKKTQTDDGVTDGIEGEIIQKKCFVLNRNYLWKIIFFLEGNKVSLF